MKCEHPKLRLVEYLLDMQYHPHGHPQIYNADVECAYCNTTVLSRGGFSSTEARAWLEKDWPNPARIVKTAL